MATPVVALGADGAWYDAALLEAAWGIQPALETTDFHMRVIAARCLGLHELDARLSAGPRPAAARIQTADMLVLPPCDTDRAALFQLASPPPTRTEPVFWRADARTLVGDGQPTPVPRGAPSLQVGVAVVIGEELFRATAREAARAIAGFTLQLDWGRDAPSTLGPALIVGRSLRDVGGLEVTVTTGDGKLTAPVGAWPFHPAESIAFISQAAPLRPGDVVGLGGVLPSRLAVDHGERVTATLAPLLRLSAWATQAPEPASWRF